MGRNGRLTVQFNSPRHWAIPQCEVWVECVGFAWHTGQGKEPQRSLTPKARAASGMPRGTQGKRDKNGQKRPFRWFLGSPPIFGYKKNPTQLGFLGIFLGSLWVQPPAGYNTVTGFGPRKCHQHQGDESTIFFRAAESGKNQGNRAVGGGGGLTPHRPRPAVRPCAGLPCMLWLPPRPRRRRRAVCWVGRFTRRFFLARLRFKPPPPPGPAGWAPPPKKIGRLRAFTRNLMALRTNTHTALSRRPPRGGSGPGHPHPLPGWGSFAGVKKMPVLGLCLLPLGLQCLLPAIRAWPTRVVSSRENHANTLGVALYACALIYTNEV